MVLTFIYFRLAITNEGNAAARDVQVYLAAAERLRADGKYENVEQVSPMNLMWSNVLKPTLPELLPKMPDRFCDLAHISDPNEKLSTGEWLTAAPTEPVLALDLEVRSNSRGFLLPKGEYRFKLKLVASNHPPRDYSLQVNSPAVWYEDQNRMFSEGFGMRLL